METINLETKKSLCESCYNRITKKEVILEVIDPNTGACSKFTFWPEETYCNAVYTKPLIPVGIIVNCPLYKDVPDTGIPFEVMVRKEIEKYLETQDLASNDTIRKVVNELTQMIESSNSISMDKAIDVYHKLKKLNEGK